MVEKEVTKCSFYMINICDNHKQTPLHQLNSHLPATNSHKQPTIEACVSVTRVHVYIDVVEYPDRLRC